MKNPREGFFIAAVRKLVYFLLPVKRQITVGNSGYVKLQR